MRGDSRIASSRCNERICRVQVLTTCHALGRNAREPQSLYTIKSSLGVCSRIYTMWWPNPELLTAPGVRAREAQEGGREEGGRGEGGGGGAGLLSSCCCVDSHATGSSSTSDTSEGQHLPTLCPSTAQPAKVRGNLARLLLSKAFI